MKTEAELIAEALSAGRVTKCPEGARTIRPKEMNAALREDRMAVPDAVRREHRAEQERQAYFEKAIAR